MTAASEQQQVGKLEPLIDQTGTEGMAFEMIDRDQRLVRRKRQPLADKQANHHSADQSGTGGRGDGVDLSNGDVGLVQHLADQAGKDFDMGAGGDFRDHAPERAVGVILPDHRLGEDLPVAADQRGGAVVAGGFKGKDQGHFAQAFA